MNSSPTRWIWERLSQAGSIFFRPRKPPGATAPNSQTAGALSEGRGRRSVGSRTPTHRRATHVWLPQDRRRTEPRVREIRASTLEPQEARPRQLSHLLGLGGAPRVHFLAGQRSDDRYTLESTSLARLQTDTVIYRQCFRSRRVGCKSLRSRHAHR